MDTQLDFTWSYILTAQIVFEPFIFLMETDKHHVPREQRAIRSELRRNCFFFDDLITLRK